MTAWVKEMDNLNFLGILDVMQDIKTEINISSERIIIPLLQQRIKYIQLFPVDSIGTRDIYCEMRWKAANFLKKNKVIEGFKLHEGFHRWDNRLEIYLDKDTFEKMLDKMEKEYDRRTKGKDKKQQKALDTFWDLLHPKIVQVSKSRYDTKHFADSVEAAFKEVNNTVKVIVKQQTGEEYDGSDLMNRAFSLQNPIIRLDDLSSETGKNIQKGYMQIFSGSMTGIRNPKAHENIVIDSNRAIHFLFLASLLLYKIDEKK